MSSWAITRVMDKVGHDLGANQTREFPPSSVSFRGGPDLVSVSDGNMSGGKEDDVGGAYLDTRHAMALFFGESRPNLVLLRPFPASVSIRLLPAASVRLRFGPHRVRVSYGNMLGGQDGDVGRAYGETQQAPTPKSHSCYTNISSPLSRPTHGNSSGAFRSPAPAWASAI